MESAERTLFETAGHVKNTLMATLFCKTTDRLVCLCLKFQEKIVCVNWASQDNTTGNLISTEIRALWMALHWF